MNTSGKYFKFFKSQIFMITVNSNTLKAKKRESLIRDQKLKTIQKL